MNQITREQAFDLAKYRYKLVDKEGHDWMISSVSESRTFIEEEPDVILLDLIKNHEGVILEVTILMHEIGRDYFILCRDLSQLTETIEHEEKSFVPIDVLNDSILFTKYTVDCIDGVYCLLADYKNGVDVLYDFEKDMIAGWHFNLGFPQETVKQIQWQ